MSVMGCILSKVMEEEKSQASGAPLASRGIAKGPLTFPPPVDLVGLLDRIAAKRKEKLHWRTSIVDLLKLLNLDSSFASRWELAQELGYSDCAQDSATMNGWLHRQVMRKLSESHPKVLSSYLN